MNGKKILSLLILFSLGWSVFRPPAALALDANAKLIMQYLTTVHPDGTAEFSSILKISKTAIQNSNLPTATICQHLFSTLEKTVGHFEQESKGEDIWCTYTKKVEDLEALKVEWNDWFNLTVRRLEIQNGTFYIDLSLGNVTLCKSTDTSQFTCEFAVQAPGKVGANNATRLEGNILIWDMSESVPPYRITAQSAVGSGILGINSTAIAILIFVMCGCCLMILLIGGGIAAYVILRKRKPATVNPETAASSAPIAQGGPFPPS
jgi:hypothetical protein